MVTVSSSATPPHGALAKDVTAQNFMQDVLQASLEAPVALFFHSPASPNCASFGALLEKQIAGAGGKLKLARVNIDKSPEIAQQFRIRSVPTLYIVAQGQPVDGIAGALGEAELKKFLGRFTGPDPMAESIDAALDEAEAMFTNGDVESAQDIFTQIVQAIPDNARAVAGLAQCLGAAGELDQALALLEQTPAEAAKQPVIVKAKTALSLLKNAQSGPDVSSLLAKLEMNADDHESRFALANQFFAAGKQQEAIDELLTIFRKDRAWNEEAARKQLLTYFDALGPTHPLTLSGRRKLSSLLFS